jgi:methionine biosynthesis protein MetW
LTTESKVVEQAVSPDEAAAGLIEGPLNPLRYDGHGQVLDEVSGIVTLMIPRGARVLELGCGTGSLCKIVADACRAEVVGIEPDSKRAERAKARGVQVFVADLTEELIEKIAPFDIVLLADVLEHVPYPQAMLLLSRHALKPGGAVIISVPNVAHWSVRADLLRGKFRYQQFGIMDATHLRWFTAASIESLLASAGFKVTEYRATAGLTLPDNVDRRPWRWLAPSCRVRLLRLACRRWPTLFGCQHVLKAEMT